LDHSSSCIQTVIALTSDESFRANIPRNDPGGQENEFPQQQI
jgi:hypothetical protein